MQLTPSVRLQPEVSKEHVKDYNKFVSKKNEMWLGKMEAKAKAGKYLSVEAFRADVEQVGVNARTYNSQGKFKYPGMFPLFTSMPCISLQYVQERTLYMVQYNFGLESNLA